MTAPVFQRVLAQTGYLANGHPVRGMTLSGTFAAPGRLPSRFDFMFDRNRFPLPVSGLFRAGGTPTIVFIDASDEEPDAGRLLAWHSLAWNFGLAPILWITTPTRLLLLNSYAPPNPALDRVCIAQFDLRDDGKVAEAVRTCGRIAFDSGSFWRSPFARSITRKNRVDSVLLRELAALERVLCSAGLPPLLAQKLIGRTIFSQYLVDRGLLVPERLARLFGSNKLTDLMREPAQASALFAWLKEAFNGDLFPPDIAGETDLIKPGHIGHLADFLDGFEASSKQWRLFPFRFDVIPVELISSIYEQFAHSIAGSEASAQGLHYTPTSLVDIVLDQVFGGLDGHSVVLDPACGSGVFLVEAMRRIVFLRSQSQPLTRALVREVLYTQIHGVDINPGALQVTAFSLYLAALELDPYVSAENVDLLRFDHLIGRTLHKGSFFDVALPSKHFHLIVGNPPWTYRKGERGARASAPSHAAVSQPRRSPDWAFLWRARDLAIPGTRIALLMKATPFFSKERAASEARRALLTTFKDVTLINFSQLRTEELFPAVQAEAGSGSNRKKATTGPAMLFAGTVAADEPGNSVSIANVPWSPGFRRHGVLDLVPDLWAHVDVALVRSDPVLFKAATYGNAREFAVMQDLRTSDRLMPLSTWCRQNGVSADQGFQSGGGHGADASALQGLPLLDAAAYRPGRVSPDLRPFKMERVHRPRKPSIYRAPLVLCPEASFTKALQRGRYSAALSPFDVAFTDSFVGLSFANADKRLAPLLNLILNSKVAAFQLAMGSSNIGLKQPKVEKIDLDYLMVPDVSTLSPARFAEVARLNDLLAGSASAQTLHNLDDFVCDLYGLPSFDRHVIDDVLQRTRPLFMDTSLERERSVEHVPDAQLVEYGNEVSHWLDTLIRGAGIFRTVLERGVRLGPDLVGLRFEVDDGPLKPLPRFAVEAPELLEFDMIRKAMSDRGLEEKEKRFLRLYAGRIVYVIKPDERRYWSVSEAQVDVQRILDDHNSPFRKLPRFAPVAKQAQLAT